MYRQQALIIIITSVLGFRREANYQNEEKGEEKKDCHTWAVFFILRGLRLYNTEPYSEPHCI